MSSENCSEKTSKRCRAKSGLPEHPEKGSVVYHDTVVKGLMLFVYTNSKTFHIYKFVGGKPIKPKLGNFPDMTVEQARKSAIQMLGTTATGAPVVSRRVSNPSGLDLGELIEHYIDEYAKHHCMTWGFGTFQSQRTKNFRRCR